MAGETKGREVLGETLEFRETNDTACPEVRVDIRHGHVCVPDWFAVGYRVSCYRVCSGYVGRPVAPSITFMAIVHFPVFEVDQGIDEAVEKVFDFGAKADLVCFG